MSNAPLYDALRSPRSPRAPKYDDSPTYSRLSHDSESDESLRALEISEGPLLAEDSRGRGRSYSVSGFDFENDLLPLSASLSEREDVRAESREKHIGLLNGMLSSCFEGTDSSVYIRRDCTMCGSAGACHVIPNSAGSSAHTLPVW